MLAHYGFEPLKLDNKFLPSVNTNSGLILAIIPQIRSLAGNSVALEEFHIFFPCVSQRKWQSYTNSGLISMVISRHLCLRCLSKLQMVFIRN